MMIEHDQPIDDDISSHVILKETETIGCDPEVDSESISLFIVRTVLNEILRNVSNLDEYESTDDKGMVATNDDEFEDYPLIKPCTPPHTHTHAPPYPLIKTDTNNEGQMVNCIKELNIKNDVNCNRMLN